MISGGPVYVSDKPGAHDTVLLARLALPGGLLLQPLLPGRPTRDCLFVDPCRCGTLVAAVHGTHVYKCRLHAAATLPTESSAASLALPLPCPLLLKLPCALRLLVAVCLQGRRECAQGVEQELLQRSGGSLQPAGGLAGSTFACFWIRTSHMPLVMCCGGLHSTAAGIPAKLVCLTGMLCVFRDPSLGLLLVPSGHTYDQQSCH